MRIDFSGLEIWERGFLMERREYLGGYEERAAIYEFEGRYGREAANKLAYLFCWKMYKIYRQQAEESFYGTKRR